jgi:hypothetical protein
LYVNQQSEFESITFLWYRSYKYRTQIWKQFLFFIGTF